MLAPQGTTGLDVPALVAVPDTIEEATDLLDGFGGLVSAGNWGTAAVVYAWTTDDLTGRGNSFNTEGVCSIAEFARKGIRGLASENSVRKYRRAWEYAIERGWAAPAAPGGRVVLPAEPFKAGPTDPELICSSDDNEWYTPAVYVEAARCVLGGIDLDPASCATANKTVDAAFYYTAEENGLERPWFGRVWLNPPYGRLAAGFVARLVTEVTSGDVDAAVLLVNANCTDTAWFQPLWDHTLCFTHHRINFEGKTETSGSTHGSVFAYLGDSPEVFAAEFAAFGNVARRYP